MRPANVCEQRCPGTPAFIRAPDTSFPCPAASPSAPSSVSPHCGYWSVLQVPPEGPRGTTPRRGWTEAGSQSTAGRGAGHRQRSQAGETQDWDSSHHGPKHCLEQPFQPQLRDALLRRQDNESDAVQSEGRGARLGLVRYWTDDFGAQQASHSLLPLPFRKPGTSRAVS